MSNNDGPAASDYYKITSSQQPHRLLLDALAFMESTTSEVALDLGCGGGRDTRALLDNGFNVTAVDIELEAEPYISRLADTDRVQFICSPFDTFSFGKYDFINAQWCLSFNRQDTLYRVIAAIKTALKPGGIFTCNFFGIRDGWNNSSITKTFLSEEQLLALLVDMKLLYFNENEYDGTLADGGSKHWHVFDFIARKPS
jgi:tellurite methyltransferase